MPRWRKTTWAFAILMASFNVSMGLWLAYTWSWVNTQIAAGEAACTGPPASSNVPACLAEAGGGAGYALVVVAIVWFIGVVVLAVVWLIAHGLASRPVVARPSGDQEGVIAGRSTPQHPIQVRHAQDFREAEAMLDAYVKQGYSVQSSSENTTLLMKSTWGTRFGHLLVALLTIWWTFGIGNGVYALAVHKSDAVMIKLDSAKVLPR